VVVVVVVVVMAVSDDRGRLRVVVSGVFE
jgi:hypothetical protein